MPVYLKPGELKVKDDGGNYSGLNIFAQESVQEVIESVQEVIDSIPPDYTELVGEVDDIKSDLEQLEPGLSDDAKDALLACFQHVSWLDDDQDYYGALEAALYPNAYPKITATFTPGSHVVYTDDALNTLKPYLTVKYYQTEESSGTIVSSSDYSLSGTLVEGTSTVTVTYEGLSTRVTIPNVVDYYNIWEWSMANGDFEKITNSSIDYLSSASWGYGLDLNYNTNNNRRAAGATKGILPYVRHAEPHDVLPFYPIPVPKTANKASITITPNTQYMYTQVVQIQNEKYVRLNQVGWAQGTTTITFTAGEKVFLFFNMKYDNAGSSYPTEPTNAVVTFETVSE